MAKIGIDCKLLVGAAGSTPSAEYENVRNVAFNLERSEIDATTRAADGWEVIIAGLKKATLEFESLPSDSDTVYKTLQAAFFAGTPVAIFVSDGNGRGLDADWTLVEFGEDQPNDDVLATKIKCRPSMLTRAPGWKDGAAGGGTGGGSGE